MDKYTRDEDRRFTLRIDRDLFERIAADAKANKRSVGRHIEYLLDHHYRYAERMEKELRQMGNDFMAKHPTIPVDKHPNL